MQTLERMQECVEYVRRLELERDRLQVRVGEMAAEIERLSELQGVGSDRKPV